MSIKKSTASNFNAEMVIDAKVNSFKYLRKTLRNLSILSYREFVPGLIARKYIIKYM
jgi:hypothetical protein